MRLALLFLLLVPREDRIVFLGDSITDGHTLPLLVRQASGAVCINAGVAGDTAAGMRKRLERDVLSRRPGRVALSVGINDVLRNVPLADYEADVAAISDRLKQEKIPLLILTPTVLGAKHRAAEEALAGFIAVLRKLAAKEGYAVADVHRLMEQEPSRELLLEPDQVHLTLEGYRIMARAVLDGLGRPGIAVPATLELERMPGILREWTIRALPDGEARTLTLPQPGAASQWWVDQERRRGFAVELEKTAGPGKRYAATTTLASKDARDVFFNTGADLGSVTLNGKLLWKNSGWTGWHAGKERLPARLAAGRNTVVIESGATFFLSVTDENNW